MGNCNHCSFKLIKSEAKLVGDKVTVLRDANWGMGGVNVYSHPKGVRINKLNGGEDGERKQFRRMWAMELTDHCVC